MPTADWRVEFFRRAFLRQAPGRYAVMLTLNEAQRLGQKYTERRGAITNPMIARHLLGAITLAAPAAVDGRAHLLPLDIDAGGIAAIHALIAESCGGSQASATIWQTCSAVIWTGLPDRGTSVRRSAMGKSSKLAGCKASQRERQRRTISRVRANWRAIWQLLV